MKTSLLIIIGILITFTITFFVLGPSQGHIAEYFLTEEQFQDLVLGDNPHVSDSRNTENPNECWYQEDDGTMTPCKIESHGFGYVVTMGWILFGPYIILGIAVVSFVIWRKKRK